MSAATRLKAARTARGWSQAQLIREINRRAAAFDLPERSAGSLQGEISRWENGKHLPEPAMRGVFRELYGRTNEELGFPDEPLSDDATEELSQRLQIARRVDSETVDMFRTQIDAIRHADRRFGSALRLDQLREQIAEMERLLEHTLLPRQRAPLAAALTEACTLAGWDSLDGGTARDAWRHYERAKTAARESGSAALLAHATAEQAFVLIDAGHLDDAVELLAEARRAGKRAPELLRAWLAAAEGEGLAVAGNRTAALNAFDEAAALLPDERSHPELPFLFLAGNHLDRWRGDALTYLGDPEATDHLRNLVDEMPSSFVRARAKALVDLALSSAATGNRTAAEHYVTEARKLVHQIGSVRLRRRLERLVLPSADQ